MTDRLKIDRLMPYPEYKESGLQWMGKIPAGWSLTRTKNLFRLRIEKSAHGHGQELLSIYTHIGVRPRKDLEQKGNKASTTDGYWVVKRGDLIVNKLLAWMGAVGVSHYDGVTSPAYDILRPVSELNPDYFHNLLRTKIYLQQFKSRSRGIMEMRLRLYFDQFGQIPLHLPPLTDQEAIVRFLDWVNGRIERAIRAKKKLIALLNEQKQAIIHRAVTRGLDPTVPLKFSGIPWLGDIPKYWEVKRLRHVVKLIVSNVDKHSHKEEEAVRLCNYTDAYKNETITSHIQFMMATATKDEIARFRIRIGDVLITKDSEEWDDIGVPSLVACEAADLICGYHLAILRPDIKIMIGEFLFRVLQDKFVATQMHVRANGVTRYGLSLNAINDVLLPIPSSTDEQERICSSLSRELLSLDTTISRSEHEIALLREYRMRLAADLVTGKLDVREAAQNLPAEAEEPPIELEPEEQIEDEEIIMDE